MHRFFINCDKLLEQLVDAKNEKDYHNSRKAIAFHLREESTSTTECKSARADLKWWDQVKEFKKSGCSINETVLRNYNKHGKLQGSSTPGWLHPHTIELNELEETFPEIKLFTKKP